MLNAGPPKLRIPDPSPISRGAREWVDSFENRRKDEKTLLLLGEKAEGMEESVGRVVDGWVGDEMCGRVVA